MHFDLKVLRLRDILLLLKDQKGPASESDGFNYEPKGVRGSARCGAKRLFFSGSQLAAPHCRRFYFWIINRGQQEEKLCINQRFFFFQAFPFLNW